MSLFRDKKPLHLPMPIVHVPDPDVLWSEISTAIGAAGILIRSATDDDRPPIIEFPGRGAFSYKDEEIERLLTNWFQGINAAQMARAKKYLHSRIVQHMRHVAAANISGSGGTRWMDWRPYGQ